MNYDELVKVLRDYAEEYPPYWEEIRKAANALENSECVRSWLKSPVNKEGE